MEKLTVAVCVLLVILVAGVRVQSVTEGLKCVSSTPSTRRVSVVSYRNQTGHWTAVLEFEHKKDLGEGQGRKDNGQMQVDVDVSTETCEGVELSTRVKFTFSAPLRSALPGYEHAPGVGFYKLHTDLATWPRAREICAQEGAHLVIINSEEESAILVKMLERFPNIGNKNWAWVGLRESDTINNQFFTIFGTPLNDTGFARWAQNEPNNPNSKSDYMLVSRAGGGLADVPAAENWNNLVFVCEQELW